MCAHHKFLLWYFSVSPLWGSLATLVTAAEAIEYYCSSYWPTTPHGYCWINSDNNYTVLLLSDGDCALFKCENPPNPPHASCFQRLALFFRYVFFSRDVLLLSPLTGRCESVNGLPRWGIDTDPKPWVSTSAPISFIWKASFTLIRMGGEGLPKHGGPMEGQEVTVQAGWVSSVCLFGLIVHFRVFNIVKAMLASSYLGCTTAMTEMSPALFSNRHILGQSF